LGGVVGGGRWEVGEGVGRGGAGGLGGREGRGGRVVMRLCSFSIDSIIGHGDSNWDKEW